MKQIPLSQGMSVHLDDEDFETFSQFHWSLPARTSW